MSASMRCMNFCSSQKKIFFKLTSILSRQSSNASNLMDADPSEFSEKPEYPTIKPRFPPGKWDGFSDKHAWEMWTEIDKIKSIGILHEKLDELTKDEKVYYDVLALDKIPRVLPYKQFITKTSLIEGLPDSINSLDQDETFDKFFLKLRPILIEHLLHEYDFHLHHSFAKESKFKSPALYCNSFFASIVNVFYSLLSSTNDYIHTSQIDEEALIECFWRKQGFEEACRGLLNYGILRLQTSTIASRLIRTEQPIPEFVPREDDLCINSEVPDFEFAPTTIGQFSSTRKPSVTAGYHTKNQFWKGDPCEFHHTGFYNSCDFNIRREKWPVKESDDNIIGFGLMSSFASTLAQAYNQGFSWCNEITSPFTTLSVVSDGRKMSFYAYQLNTTEMWKNNVANPLRNICWYTPEEKLYETIDNGKVVGFNDDVLKKLLKFMMVKTAQRDMNMRPYLTDESPLSHKAFMNTKGEERWDIPHPPRLFKLKVKELDIVQETQKKIDKLYDESGKHWNHDTEKWE